MIVDKGKWAVYDLVLGLALTGSLAGGAQLQAQARTDQKMVSISGKVTALQDDALKVDTRTGPEVVKLSDRVVIRGEIPIDFSEIVAGWYVGATAAKQPDGTFRASRLHVFSEDQRGIGEGHRPLSSAPGSGLTMTNANVETVADVAVQDIKGRMLTLKYKGGELKVLVPPDALVVKRVLGDRAMLKTGATVSIQASRASDDSLTATQVTVRASGQ